MSNSIVATIYRYVIDDVVRNVHADFEGHGVDTSVLEELQRSWEAKIIQSRVASFPGEDADEHSAGRPNMHAYPYVHDTNGNNINSAASLASIINNPESMAPSAASLASLAQSGRNQLLLEDDDDADADHSHYIPQNDGSADTLVDASSTSFSGTEAADVTDDSALARWNALKKSRRLEYMRDRETALQQLDGAYDDEKDEDENYDGAGSAANPANNGNNNNNNDSTADGPAEDLDDIINSDLDDSDDEDDGEGDGEDTEHIVLCQYDKVTRSKNKWKCVLRDGIMLINGRDYLFQKANGDFEW
ncbi:transcription factor IIA subunit alpha [Coemansia erecta]|uniref:Transcription initiation factor IIA large subunit n=1 Tax=Coemansia asiatica TaxID=1052880 RepID=A0A9W7XSG4_9FUNG|nr:transcription factor IIA subunit alpha [Coemansia asiatica]KAJ2854327.1 transcription factor IIA subunit alpha [Coemansia erecta]KAJ2887519.1 transcription factor IIA subunit alpha [Coemansia asiatica]